MASVDTHDAAGKSGKPANDGPTLHAFTASVVTDNFGKRIQALEVRRWSRGGESAAPSCYRRAVHCGHCSRDRPAQQCMVLARRSRLQAER